MWNAQSVNNKINYFIQILQDGSIDICFLTESWLKSQNNNVTALLKEAGYNIYHFNRADKKGGGVAIITKLKYKSKLQKSFNYSSFECVVQVIKTTDNVNLTLITVYRHFSELCSVFFKEFYEFLEYARLHFKRFVIAGDFNIHVNKPNDTDSIKFADLLNTFSLEQCVRVDTPTGTHKLGNTIDLIITDPESLHIRDIEVDSSYILGGDHAMLYFSILCNVDSCVRKQITYRNYKQINMVDFNADILMDTNNYLLESDNSDFESCFNLYNNLYSKTLDKHAPVITTMANISTRPPWMDAEFRAARRERRKLYRTWKDTPITEINKKSETRGHFEQSRASVDILSKDKRRLFIQNSINSCKNAHRELFKIFDTLLDTSKTSLLPYSENDNILADKFNNYFVEKIVKIRDNLDTPVVSLHTPLNNNITNLCNFSPVDSETILKQIRSSKIKTSQSDPIPAFMLKESVELLVPSIVHLVNTSLQTGSTHGLKDSIVTPILKKSGLDQEVLSNYRPVCAGMFVDKLIQRNVLADLNNHMDLNNLHIPFQSGYKKHHSCETVILKIVDDVLLCLDANTCTILLILDLSAAFDTVDHDELLNILHNELGIRGTALEWFKSFLSDRRQSTSVKGCKSQSVHMKYGVPQGSVLGPVLFNIYIRNFIDVFRSEGFIVHGYADDHQLLSSFRIEFQYHALCSELPRCLGLISKWMSSHFLKLNAGKSNLLLFSPANVRDKIHIDQVYIGNNVFLPVSPDAVSLGVKIDSPLTFSPQISSIVSGSYKLIFNVGKIRKYLTINDIKCLVNAIVVSRIDNCNSVLYGLPEYEINRLQMLQNSCARLIYNRKKHDHVSDLLLELHWLPIQQRIVFKILLFVFKVFINAAPLYLTDCLKITNLENRILFIPKTKTSYGDRAFSNSAPRLWNALPYFIRMCPTLSSFKSQLKHHLFSQFDEYMKYVNRYKT